MVRIRKANYFDKFKFQKMISFLSAEAINHYTKVFMSFPFDFLHNLLPLRLKALPEAYVIEENKNIIGMVAVSPTAGNPYKLVINRLFLEQDCFSEGKQLIEYVIARYGAKGATSFIATVDGSYDELLQLFAEGCGFRQCSSEQLWKMEDIRISKTDNTFFRPFKNSDAKSVASLFNDTVINHFKPTISRTKEEYEEPVFKGLKDGCEFKYIAEDIDKKHLKAFFSITTSENKNFILDVTASPWYDCPWDDILSFAVNQISKRKKDFSLFVRVRKYTSTAEQLEAVLNEKKAKCIQNQVILVKDFYRVIKEPQALNRIVFFNEINEKPVFKL